MENEQLGFLDKAKEALQQNLRWGGMLVVIGYVMIGLLAFMGLASAFIFSQTSGIAAFVVLLMYALIFLMYYFPLRRFNGYLQGCRDSLETNNERYFIEGLKDLSGAMRLLVIYTFVVIGFYALILVLALVLGAYPNLAAI